jgi:hypothetical protein
MDGPAESSGDGWQSSAALKMVEFPNVLRVICANLEKKELLSMVVSCKAISSVALDER